MVSVEMLAWEIWIAGFVQMYTIPRCRKHLHVSKTSYRAAPATVTGEYAKNAILQRNPPPFSQWPAAPVPTPRTKEPRPTPCSGRSNGGIMTSSTLTWPWSRARTMCTCIRRFITSSGTAAIESFQNYWQKCRRRQTNARTWQMSPEETALTLPRWCQAGQQNGITWMTYDDFQCWLVELLGSGGCGLFNNGL